MPGRIPEDFINTLLDRTDIVELIGSRLSLRPAGRGEHKALCPFHEEKTPSFTVSSDKQFYHCFGCGAHGTAIGFLMEYEGLEFPAAVEELAALAGLEVPRSGAPAGPSHDGLYAALAAAQDWFVKQLGGHRPALDYLEKRGLDGQTIEAFGVGYAPAAWEALAVHLDRSGIRPADAERAGLISRRDDGRVTDRFRDRIMFPIHDRRGRVIAFGGRAMGERGPKYLNSPETPVFHKGRELYRLYQVRRGSRPERLLVVEGYMDAAALFQFGFDNAVATLGTAVTADHLDLMFRTVPVVVFCFDGDRAGRQAAWRGLEAALPVLRDNREVRFLFLPEGEDPDSMVRRHGAERFAEAVDQARPLSDFFFDHLAAGLDMASLEGRARLAALARPYLEKLPPGPFAGLMRGALVRRSGTTMELGSSDGGNQPEGDRSNLPADRPLTPIQYAVALIVQQPDLAQNLDAGELRGLGSIKGLDFFLELIDFCRSRPHLSTAKLVENWRDRPEGRWLSALAGRETCADPESRADAMAETVARIRTQLIKARVRELQQAQASQGGLDAARSDELRRLLALRSESNLR